LGDSLRSPGVVDKVTTYSRALAYTPTQSTMGHWLDSAVTAQRTHSVLNAAETTVSRCLPYRLVRQDFENTSGRGGHGSPFDRRRKTPNKTFHVHANRSRAAIRRSSEMLTSTPPYAARQYGALPRSTFEEEPLRNLLQRFGHFSPHRDH